MVAHAIACPLADSALCRVRVRGSPSVCNRTWAAQVLSQETRTTAPAGDLRKFLLHLWDGVNDKTPVYVDPAIHLELGLAGGDVSFRILSISKATFYPGWVPLPFPARPALVGCLQYIGRCDSKNDDLYFPAFRFSHSPSYISGGVDFLVISHAEWLPLPAGVAPHRRRLGSQTPAPLPPATLPLGPAGVEPGPYSVPAVVAPPDGGGGGGTGPPPPPPPGYGHPTTGFTCDGVRCNTVPVTDGDQRGATLDALNRHPGVCQLAILHAEGGPPSSGDASVWDTFQLRPELRARGPLAALPDEHRFVRYRWNARMLYGCSGWGNRIEMPPCVRMQAAHDYPNHLGTEHGWAAEAIALDDGATGEGEEGEAP